jgi:hypothetical protein
VATRLYFRSTTPDWSRGQGDASLVGTVRNWTTFGLSPAPGAAAQSQTATSVLGSTPGIEAGTSVDWISDPLDRDVNFGAGANTLLANLWGLESSMNANATLGVYVEYLDPSGAIINSKQMGLGTELNTAAGVLSTSSAYGSTITVPKGGRLRCRVYFRDATATTMASGFTLTFRYNGPTTGADGDSYIEFTENFGFLTEGPGIAQQWLEGPGTGNLFGGATQASRHATTFLAAEDKTVTSVDVWIYKNGSPTDNVELAIQADSGGAPSGTDLTSASVAGSAISGSPGGWINFNITDYTLAGGQRYWIVLRRSGAGHDSINYSWYAGAPTSGGALVPYPGGYGSSFTSVWTPVTNFAYGMAFRLNELLISQDTGSSFISAVNGATGTSEALAQKFNLSGPTFVTGVDLHLFRSGTPADNLIMSIVSTLDGTALGSVTVAATSVTSNALNRFTFSSPVILAAGDYFIQLTRSGARSTSNNIGWTEPNADVYAGGNQWTRSSGSWSEIVRDFRFIIYGHAGSPLYLTNNASDIDPGGATVDTKEAWTSRGSGVVTNGTLAVVGPTAPRVATVSGGGNSLEWFTKQLTGFTLSGLIACNIRAFEEVATQNGAVRCEIAVCAADGTSPVIWGASNDGVELGTSEAAMTFLVAGDDTAITNGQRLRIRIYWDDAVGLAMSGSGADNFVLKFAGTSLGASGDTYIILPETVTAFSSSTPVNVSDSATASDVVTGTVTTTTDSGTAADIVLLTAPYAVTDIATGADVAAVSVPISATDSATAADTSDKGMTVTDSGSGADTAPTLAKTVSDAAVGSDTSDKGMTAVDSVSGLDTSAVTVPIAATDTAVGADSITAVARDVTEQAAAVDASSLTAVYATSDTAAGVDTSALTAAYAVSDTAVGADASSVTIGAQDVVVSDSAVGTDTSAINKLVSDAATGVDASSLTAVLAAVTDTVTGADTSALAATTTSADWGNAVDGFDPVTAGVQWVTARAGQWVLATVKATTPGTPIVEVRKGTNALSGTSIPLTFDDAGTPTSGNLLVILVWERNIGTFGPWSAPGFTVANAANDQGAVLYKVSNGTESSITVTSTVSGNQRATVYELANANAIDEATLGLWTSGLQSLDLVTAGPVDQGDEWAGAGIGWNGGITAGLTTQWRNGFTLYFEETRSTAASKLLRATAAVVSTAISLNVSDSAVGVDTSDLARPVSDAATGADTSALTVAPAVSDSVAGADTSSLITGNVVNVVDSAAASDVSVLTAALPVTDAATGSDVSSLTAALPVFDTAAGADTSAINKLVSDSAVSSDVSDLARPAIDSATGSDTSTINKLVADTAVGTDVVGTIPATVSVNDAAVGSDTSALSTANQKSVNEVGVAVDASALTATNAVADSGSSVDLVAETVLWDRTDAAVGADVSALTAAPTVTDAVVGADASALTSPISVTDSGASADTSAINKAVSDAGSGSDAITTVAKAVTDAGTAADVSSLITGTAVNVVDAATGTETAVTTAVLTAQDTAAGLDTAALSVLWSRSDAAVGVDTSQVVIAIAVQDQATGIDTRQLQVALAVLDQGLGVDVAVLAAQVFKTVSDAGHAVDIATVRAGLPEAIELLARFSPIMVARARFDPHLELVGRLGAELVQRGRYEPVVERDARLDPEASMAGSRA